MLNQRPDMTVDDISNEVVLQDCQRPHLHPDAVLSMNICWARAKAGFAKLGLPNAVLPEKSGFHSARDIGRPVRNNHQDTVCHQLREGLLNIATDVIDDIQRETQESAQSSSHNESTRQRH